MKRADDPDTRFEWDMATIVVLVVVITVVGLMAVSLGLLR